MDGGSQRLRCLILSLIVWVISGCSKVATYEVSQFQNMENLFVDAAMEPVIEPIEVKELFELSPEQKTHFLEQYHGLDYRKMSDTERIYRYLSAHLNQFNFHANTLTASESLSENSGNCLSLAILTKALTKLTNVGIRYELARTPAIFQREGGLQLSSQHIRTVIYDKNVTNIKHFSNDYEQIKIDYFSTLGSRTLRRVKKDEFYSMYYSNRAAEALLESEDRYAYWHIRKALDIKSDNLLALNILGLIYQRAGMNQMAETVFLHGLSHGEEQLEMLNNYHNLLMASDRETDAAIIANVIETHGDKDPFKWIDLGDSELSQKNYRRAIQYYERASEMAEYLHQPFAGIAQANFQLGRVDEAINAMQLAIENSHRIDTTSIYQAKMDWMRDNPSVN